MKRAISLLAAFAVVVSAEVAEAQVPTDTIPLALRQRIVSETRELIDKRFAHSAGIPGFDFDAEFARYSARVLANPSRWEFSLLTRAFIASLRNGHTTFGDTWVRDADPATLPFALRFIGGQWIVSSSRTQDIRVGDVVVTIDDEPVESFYAKQSRFISASSDRTRRLEFTSRGFLWPKRFAIGLERGRTFSVERTAAPRDTAPTSETVRDHWIDTNKIAYVAIASFGQSMYETSAVERITTKYRNAPALIVDVRGNGGGNTPRDLIKTLLNGKEFVWWKEDPYRLPNATFDKIGAAMKRRGNATNPYAGRILILTDGSCGSACEDFVMPLKWQKRATVIGDTTAGTTGQPVFLRFDNGIQISVSAKRSYFPDGSPFEGVGIAPDVLIVPTREQLTSREDRVLAAALELARGVVR